MSWESSIVFGLGITTFLLFYASFSLENTHIALKVLFIGISIWMFPLIMQVLDLILTENTVSTDGLHTLILRANIVSTYIAVIVSLYILFYFIWVVVIPFSQEVRRRRREGD